MRPEEERCEGCAVQRAFCFCAALSPPIATAARVLIVRHHRERQRPSNTARIAARALARAELRDYGAPGEAPLAFEPLEGAALLYPATEEAPRPPELPPAVLVVLDGTWTQTQRLVRRHAELARLPRVSLPAPARGLSEPRLRTSDDPARLLTMEAIARYLMAHEGGSAGARLLAVHRRFVAATLAGRGARVPERWVREAAALAGD